MFSRVFVIVGILLAVIVLLLGCGGTSASDYMGTLERMSKEDLKAMKAAEITANDAPSIWIAKTEDYMALGVTQLKELQQITPPAGFAGAHTKLLVSYERSNALSRALIRAMRADDSDAYEAAYQQGTSELYAANSVFIEALTAAADEAGVSIPQAVFQDFPTSVESLPSSDNSE